jgi:hypothetical protein
MGWEEKDYWSLIDDLLETVGHATGLGDLSGTCVLKKMNFSRARASTTVPRRSDRMPGVSLSATPRSRS